MKLPILLSVPHAGLVVPELVRPICRLSPEEILADGDEGAAEIYALADHVVQFATSDVARAVVDLNRAADDFRPDGVVKTVTCWNVPVYTSFPPPELIDALLSRYYHPYHQALRAPDPQVRLGVDCHTMAAVGPPIGPDAGAVRPPVCLGDGGGVTMPRDWTRTLADCFARAFEVPVAINKPFRGGYITRSHGRERPWVQVELSRAPFLAPRRKRQCVLQALTEFCETVFF